MIQSPLDIKAGTKSFKTCPCCKQKIEVEWVAVEPSKLPKFLLEKRKKLLQAPEKIQINSIDSILCFGYWRGECNCQKVEKRLDYRDFFVGLPKRFENVEWQKLKTCSSNKKAIEAAVNWCKTSDPKPFGLYYFSEEAGTGKTTLAALCGKTMAAKGKRVLFIRAASIPDMTEEVYAEAKETKYLIVDDLDKIRNTDFGIEKLFELIDYRHSEMLPTIVTSNLTPSGIAQRYGSSLASRLCDRSSFGVFEVGGSDRRLENF